jgi:hypothetical protein
MAAKLAELESRLSRLEEQIRLIQERLRDQEAQRPAKDWRRTFGMFAGDEEFGEIIRLGREYRDRVNKKSLESLE